MAEIVPYARTPVLRGSDADRRRLKAVEVGHYVLGGLALLPFGGMFLLSLLALPFHGLADEPGSSGLVLIATMVGVSAAGSAVGWLTVWSGRCIAKRRRRRFSVAWSALFTLISVGVVAIQVKRLLDIRRFGIDPYHTRGPLLVAALAAVGMVLAMYAFLFLRGGAAATVYDSVAAVPGSGHL